MYVIGQGFNQQIAPRLKALSSLTIGHRSFAAGYKTTAQPARDQPFPNADISLNQSDQPFRQAISGRGQMVPLSQSNSKLSRKRPVHASAFSLLCHIWCASTSTVSWFRVQLHKTAIQLLKKSGRTVQREVGRSRTTSFNRRARCQISSTVSYNFVLRFPKRRGGKSEFRWSELLSRDFSLNYKRNLI